jgi:hypothetical protein
MSRKVGTYLRQNHLALLALFIALGGTGAYAAGKIGPSGIRKNAIRSQHIKNGAVTGADVLDGGLTGADLQDQSITGADVQKSSLTGLDVGDGSLTAADLKAESLTGTSILNGSLSGADVRAESLLGTNILNGTLTGLDVADGSLTGADVQEGGLTGADVQSESLTGEDVFNGSLSGADLAAGTVAPSNLAVIPSARVRRTATQSIPNGSFTAIQLTSETWDHLGLHSSTNNTRLTAPIDGVYLITANVFWASNTSGGRVLGITVNGGSFIGFVAQPASSVFPEVPLSVTTAYLLGAGDFIEAKVQQTSGGALNLDASSGGAETSPEVSMTWLGPG